MRLRTVVKHSKRNKATTSLTESHLVRRGMLRHGGGKAVGVSQSHASLRRSGGTET